MRPLSCNKAIFGNRTIKPFRATIQQQQQQLGSNVTSSTLVRTFSVREKKDKFGRLVQRRVIRPRILRKNASRFFLPKMSKILMGQNIIPKPLRSLPETLSPTTSKPSGINRVDASTRLSINGAPTQKNSPQKTILKWLSENMGVLILNSGSIATLTAFTRTDILELRILSITGSITTIFYFATRPLPGRVYAPIIWSAIFASVNAYMVYHIYVERKMVQAQIWTEEEEMTYEEHFLPHGVTPRQFERLLSKAKKLELKRGSILVKKGEELSSVYLVTSGITQATTSNMKRRVTAASSAPGNRNNLAGGDAGAWIGELAFLEELASLQKQQSSQILSSKAFENSKKPHDICARFEQEMEVGSEYVHTAARKAKLSLLTYIVTQDSSLLEWKYEDLVDLLIRGSPDMRSSVTNAMTAAVVGKVVNLYASKSDVASQGTNSWKNWLVQERKGKSSKILSRPNK